MMKRSLLYRALTFVPGELRTRGLFLLLLLIFASVLDLFSLASFFPLILVIIDPDKLDSNVISKTYFGLGFDNTTSLASALIIVAFVFLVLKTLFNTWVTYRKSAYAYSVGQRLAEKILANYFKTPHEIYSSIDYAREMNRICNAPLTFSNNFIIPLGTTISETIVGMVLVLAAALYEPGIFIFLVIVITPLTLLYGIVRSRIRKSGGEIKHQYPLLLKNTLQSVEGLTEIRSFKKESFFQARFTAAFKKVADVFSRDHVIHTGTGRVSELIAGICICALLFYSVFFGKTSTEAILVLSVYAAISFRIIPSINRIFSSLIQMKTHEHVLEELGEQNFETRSELSEKTQPSVFADSIELKNISFRYGHNPILDDASLTFHKNEKIIVHGKSGSGKTTLLLLLMGFLKQNSGEIFLDGKKLKAGEVSAFQRLFGYVPQDPYMLDGSILENIAFGLADQDIDRYQVNLLLQELDLAPWVNSLPQGMDANIGENGNKISGGQRQRIAIARALYYDPKILLLDEVTNQLDRNTEAEVMKVLNSPIFSTKTIILITHRPEIWKSFDTVYELSHGKFQQVVFSEAH